MSEIKDSLEKLRETLTRIECGGLTQEDRSALTSQAYELIGSVVGKVFRVMSLLSESNDRCSNDFFLELFGEECCKEWENDPDKKMADIGFAMMELRYFDQALRRVTEL